MQASDDQPNYFKVFYSPTHLNIGNYFIGVAAGLFQHKVSSSKAIHEKSLASQPS